MPDERIETDEYVLLQPPNSHRIETVYAWVSRDEHGNEGICAGSVTVEGIPMMTPLVCTSERELPVMLAQAHFLSSLLKRKLYLISFAVRTEVDSVDPGEAP